MACCNNRYQVEYTKDASGSLIIASITQVKDAAGTVIDPPVTAFPGDANFATFLSDTGSCADTSVRADFEVLCDENGDPVVVRYAEIDGVFQPVSALAPDGTPYAGPTALADLESCSEKDVDVEVTESLFCDAGVEKTRVIIKIFGADGTQTAQVTEWLDVLGVVTTAPLDPLLVTAGACPVSQSIFVAAC